MTKAWVGFVRYDGKSKDVPFGWKVIRWFSQDDTVHVFLVFKTDSQPAMIYQTSETTYESEPLENRLKSPCELYELPFDGAVLKYECQKLLGHLYDYPGIAALGFFLLLERGLNWIAGKAFKLFGGKPSTEQIVFIGNPFHVNGAYFCSEAVVSCMAAAQPGFFPTWWTSESMFPKTLRNFCAANLVKSQLPL